MATTLANQTQCTCTGLVEQVVWGKRPVLGRCRGVGVARDQSKTSVRRYSWDTDKRDMQRPSHWRVWTYLQPQEDVMHGISGIEFDSNARQRYVCPATLHPYCLQIVRRSPVGGVFGPGSISRSKSLISSPRSRQPCHCLG